MVNFIIVSLYFLVQAEWVGLLILCIMMLTVHKCIHTQTYTIGSLVKRSLYTHISLYTHSHVHTYTDARFPPGVSGRLPLAAGYMRHWLYSHSHHVDKTHTLAQHTHRHNTWTRICIAPQTIEPLHVDMHYYELLLWCCVMHTCCQVNNKNQRLGCLFLFGCS